MEKKQRLSALFGAKVEGASPIEIREMSPALQESLKAFDLDGDGKVDSYELARAAEAYRQAQTRARRLNRMLLAGSALLLVVLAAFSGLVFTVVELTKESHVTEGTLTVKNSNETVRTSQALSQDRLCSQMSDASFREMRYLDISSPSGASLSFLVQGWARIPKAHSMHGTVVAIVTQIGTVTVDGSHLYFEDDVAPIFSRAGFEVAASKRSLAGMYDLLAMFNNVVVVDECGHEMADTMEPSFPSGNFIASTTKYVELDDTEIVKARPQGLKTINGKVFGIQNTKVYNDETNDRVREETSYPAVGDHHTHVSIETRTSAFSFQIDSRSGLVSYCQDNSGEKNPDEVTDAGSVEPAIVLEYHGATTCPLSGGECRKFTQKGSAAVTYYDQKVAGEYMIKEIDMAMTYLVFNSFQQVAEFKQDAFTFPTCPSAHAPWGVPGTTMLEADYPVNRRSALHHIVSPITAGAIRAAPDMPAAIAEAETHMGLVSMGIDGHDFMNNAVNATAFGFQDLAQLKAAVIAKGEELSQKGMLDDAVAVSGLKSKTVRPENPVPSTVDENGSIEEWDASEPTETEEEKSGRKPAGYTSGGDHWEYEFEYKDYKVILQSQLQCAYSMSDSGQDCELSSGGLCDANFYVTIKLKISFSEPCKRTTGCANSVAMEFKVGWDWTGVLDYFSRFWRAVYGIIVSVLLGCYYFFSVTVGCHALTGCFNLVIWLTMGGSLMVQWSTHTLSGEASGCIFATYGFPSVYKKVLGKKFSSDKVINKFMGKLEFTLKFCITIGRYYDSMSTCHYVKIGFTLTISIGGISVRFSKYFGAGLDVSCTVGLNIKFSIPHMQGSKYCHGNYIKYIADNTSKSKTPAYKPGTQAQLYISGKFTCYLYVKGWRWKKKTGFGLSKKFTSKWWQWTIKFNEDMAMHHTEALYYSGGSYYWKASSTSGRRADDTGIVADAGYETPAEAGAWYCENGCKI